MDNVYIIDTSALIDAKRYYPPSQFETFWEYLIDMTKKGDLIIINKVVDELKKGNDYLSDGFVKRIRITDAEEKEYLLSLQNIIKGINPSEYEGWKQWFKKADPWIVAVANKIKKSSLAEPIIIHNERTRGKQLKIETECLRLGIKNDRIHRIIRDGKMSFTHD